MRIQPEREPPKPTLLEVVKKWAMNSEINLSALSESLSVVTGLKPAAIRQQLYNANVSRPVFKALQDQGIIPLGASPEDYSAKFTTSIRRAPGKKGMETRAPFPMNYVSFWDAEYAESLIALIKQDGGNAEVEFNMRGIDVPSNYLVKVHAFGSGKSAEDYREVATRMKKEDEEKAIKRWKN